VGVFVSVQYESRKQLGYASNKDVVIKSLRSIEINKFRTFVGRRIELGGLVTVIAGRNGTMKTSLMGLVAHPFSSDSKDAFGRILKTSLSEVFKLSTTYDQDNYSYDLVAECLDKEALLKEKVSIYYVKGKTNRHRVVLSGGEKGDGNFPYCTSFLNLSRLLPLIDTNAAPDKSSLVKLTTSEAKEQKTFFQHVIPTNTYGNFEPIRDGKLKTTFGPSGPDARYNYEAISSGEDNLGAIFNRLVGFQRAHAAQPKDGRGTGILCIDEFEAGLHPVAQIRLLDYLLKWCRKYSVQVVITTHSLNLIQSLYGNKYAGLASGDVRFNLLSCEQTGHDRNFEILINPDYATAYQELTLETPRDVVAARKINVFCEDDVGVNFFKTLVKSRDILNIFSFHTNLDESATNSGTAYTGLVGLCKNYSLLLKESLVIFDADVPASATDRILDKSTYLLLPDADRLGLERRVMCYVRSLAPNDKFFTKFKKSQETFLHEFTDAGVMDHDLEALKSETKTPMSQCKGWVKRSGTDFKKYVTHYVAESNVRTGFVEELVAKVNLINERRGLPRISVKP
jgi:hypothetical protein